jgi:hypothetical protein
MKYFLFIICFYSVLNSNAQIPKNISNHSVITTDEFTWAKENYVKMMKTETYLEYKKSLSNYIKKMNRLSFPRANFNLEKFLTDHLSETNFKTVEEALSMKNNSVDLLLKLMQENRKLYDLLEKSSSKQLGEILKPEREIHENRKLFSRPK